MSYSSFLDHESFKEEDNLNQREEEDKNSDKRSLIIQELISLSKKKKSYSPSTEKNVNMLDDSYSGVDDICVALSFVCFCSRHLKRMKSVNLRTSHKPTTGSSIIRGMRSSSYSSSSTSSSVVNQGVSNEEDTILSSPPPVYVCDEEEVGLVWDSSIMKDLIQRLLTWISHFIQPQDTPPLQNIQGNQILDSFSQAFCLLNLFIGQFQITFSFLMKGSFFDQAFQLTISILQTHPFSKFSIDTIRQMYYKSHVRYFSQVANNLVQIWNRNRNFFKNKIFELQLSTTNSQAERLDFDELNLKIQNIYKVNLIVINNII